MFLVAMLAAEALAGKPIWAGNYCGPGTEGKVGKMVEDTYIVIVVQKILFQKIIFILLSQLRL